MAMTKFEPMKELKNIDWAALSAMYAAADVFQMAMHIGVLAKEVTTDFGYEVKDFRNSYESFLAEGEESKDDGIDEVRKHMKKVLNSMIKML